MNAAWIITKKRDGQELAGQEIRDLINGYVAGDVPDYQMAAWAMAVFLKGMSTAEIAALTHAMLESGEVLAHTPGAPRVDKHSSGGIGDKASLPLAPALACCGVRVPMISGRGLGATGGTLDKLEAIPGYRTDLSIEEMQRVADEVGCVISSASEKLVPADRKLYALRDVTATVPCIPLITASIMSKKLAEGLDALVLDVKHGSGAFMKTLDDARALARSLVDTGKRMGVATSALLTDMNQPLGRLAGNALEVDESVACLQGGGPADLREVTLELGAEALVLAGAATDTADGLKQMTKAIDSGAALEKFAEMVRAQGGDLDAPRPLAGATEIASATAGVVAAIDTEQLGWAVIEMGGGRKQLGDPIDHGVGLEMLVRLGDPVDAEQPLAKLYSRDAARAAAEKMVLSAIQIGDGPVAAPPLIAERVC
ncbi:Pyrimidine-nucleoside phosphorylase [Posidoniimonas polymericola]|uniref:thymidine phosphorylase n=1 Tax=Posidoniimonas polymericola TaxID=2528002 RepID=A0A5C5XUQ3_9BACT|nr:thymidine phosphorylase [Posidoniimonas polymericola]TWT66997.1 Pyrimidine-nucleoside phosphorylase [Posidoniimonas polymericola]